jgi:ADP-heptose:LPS heptosyltransferase
MTQTPAAQEKILVIKLGALGDFLLALGAMEGIRRRYPKAHITLMTTGPFSDMAQRSRYFDAIEVVARGRFWDLGMWLRMRRFLNAGFDRVYDLQLSGRSSFFFRLMRKKPLWCGVARHASDNYATVNPDWRRMHAFERHKAMLARHGIDVFLPSLGWMQADISLLAPSAPYVILIPGCAPRHPYKRWPAAKYAALALKLQHQGYEICLVGTTDEQDAIARIRNAAPRCHDLSGRTSLYDIAALSARAAGAVGNDTGPAHLAAMAGCPLVVLFSGHTDPVLSAPVGDEVTVIQSADISDISVDDVARALRLRGAAAPAPAAAGDAA